MLQSDYWWEITLMLVAVYENCQTVDKMNTVSYLPLHHHILHLHCPHTIPVNKQANTKKTNFGKKITKKIFAAYCVKRKPEYICVTDDSRQIAAIQSTTTDNIIWDADYSQSTTNNETHTWWSQHLCHIHCVTEKRLTLPSSINSARL